MFRDIIIWGLMTFYQLKLIFSLIVGSILIYFVVANAQARADFTLVFTQFTDVPVILLMFLSFMTGVIFVPLFSVFSGWNRSRRLQDKEKKKEQRRVEKELPKKLLSKQDPPKKSDTISVSSSTKS